MAHEKSRYSVTVRLTETEVKNIIRATDGLFPAGPRVSFSARLRHLLHAQTLLVLGQDQTVSDATVVE